MNNSEINFPKSWVAIPVNDAVISISTNGKKIPQKQYIPNGSLPVIDQGQDYIGGYTDDMAMKVECELPVIVFGDHTRIVKYVNIAFAPGADGVKVLQPQKFFYPKLLSYFIQYLTSKLTNHGYARHYQHLSKETLPVPPLNEQHRIVAKIEELFSELDKGIENLKTAQAQLKVYRQALLKHAFEGKLTAQWRAENQDKLETADALLKRIQHEHRQHYQQQLADWEASGKRGSKPKAPKPLPPITAEELAELPELPEGWRWVRIIDLISDSTLGLDRGSQYQKSMPPGLPYIKMNNVTMDGHVTADKLVYVGVDESEQERYVLREGDILFNTRNSKELVGKTGLVRKFLVPTVYNNNLMRIRLHNGIFPNFVCHQMCSTGFKSKLEDAKKGTTNVAAVYAKDLFPLLLVLAPQLEQQRIAELVDARLSEIDQLDQTITTSLRQAEALRQSILKRALSGQLVPQDANDEPASVLLARIKAEKMNTASSESNQRRTRKVSV